MDVGREMDLLIAEHVMGFRREIDTTYDYHKVQHRTEVLLPPGRTLHEFRDLLPRSGAIPFGFFVDRRYSTDIAAAFTVAQKLGLALVPQSTDSGFAWLACDLEAVRYGAAGITLVPHWPTAISAPTAPEAVCRAALASVGVRE